MSAVIKDPRRIVAGAGGSSVPPWLVTDVNTLKNNEYKVTYFTEISAATGTITIPTGATILLDQFQSGVDAYVSTIQNSQPTGTFPQTAGAVTVDVTSFDALGNYTLSGTPSAYPVALIYILKINAIDYSNIDKAHELDFEDIGGEKVANKATNFSIVNNILYPTVQAVSTFVTGLGYITGINFAMVVAALGFTPISASSTDTLTNKRITKRVVTIAAAANPTYNTDLADCIRIVGLNTNITSMTTNLSGTPQNMDILMVRITDDGTSRTIAWGAMFATYGANLPTFTTINKEMTIVFMYTAASGIWNCMDVAQQP
jgi:hypothetical protein